MAFPDCQDGWYKRSVELDAALEYADFRKPARIIMRFVLLQAFRYQEVSQTVSIVQAEIARRSGQLPPNIKRGLDELEQSNVLIRIDRTSFRLNLDYETWLSWSRTPDHQPSRRLSEVEIADCRAVLGYFRDPVKSYPVGEEKVIPPDKKRLSGGITSEEQEFSGGIRKSYPVGEEKVIPPDKKIVPPLEPPIRNRELELRNNPPPTPQVGQSSADDSSEPFIPTEKPTEVELDYRRRPVVRSEPKIREWPGRLPIRNDLGLIQIAAERARELWPSDPMARNTFAEDLLYFEGGEGQPAKHFLGDVQRALLDMAIVEDEQPGYIRRPWLFFLKIVEGWMAETGGRPRHPPVKNFSLGPPESRPNYFVPPLRPKIKRPEPTNPED